MVEMFTNEAFFGLSEEQKHGEALLMLPLRRRHTRELLEAGTAVRVLGSVATSVLDTPGALVIPFRNPTWSSAIHRAESETGDPIALALTDRLHASYDVALTLQNRGQIVATEPAGVIYANTLVQALGISPYGAASGVEISDVLLIERQLAEVEAHKMHHNIAMIDPATLIAGAGETIVNP